MLREIREETQIDPPNLFFKGIITWTSVEGTDFGGMYLYLAELPEEYTYPTPIKMDEGILDWKEINWIIHPENRGVASNIPSCLEKVLYDPHCYNHHSIFSTDRMVKQISSRIDPRIEENENLRNTYLQEFMEERRQKSIYDYA